MLFRALACSSLIALAACSDAPKSQTSEPPTKIAKTKANHPGMVASANPLATAAGVEILRKGGSAVDAAVAVQVALGLVEPQSSGLGGGAFMVVYDPKTAKVWAYNGRETAPAGATDSMFLDAETGKPRSYFDRTATGQSTGAPGAVVMLHMAHNDYGKLPWADTLAPAIPIAENGFTVSPRMGDLVARFSQYVLGRDAAARAYFFTDVDTPIKTGDTLRNPAYADTLRALQANPRALLEGPIAAAIVAKVNEDPFAGTLTLADLAGYQPLKREALCTPYRAHMVCGAQPPASGGVAVQSILGTLENFDMRKIGPSGLGWHLFAEASFLAYADRDKYVADPDFVDVPVTQMLDKRYLASRANLIKIDAAMASVRAGNPVDYARGKDATPDTPGTSHFTVVDSDGLVVSMTTTVEGAFGSQRMVGGFLLNNQLTDFSSVPVDADGAPIANAVAPGKRPRSSMSPHIVFAPSGEFLFSTGSPGGNSIIAYTAKTIVGLIDWQMTPQEVIELPNVIARNRKIRLEAKNLKAEAIDGVKRGGPAAEFGMDDGLIDTLEGLGHDIVRSEGEISGLHIIYRDPETGALIGGADPRREGVATGL